MFFHVNIIRVRVCRPRKPSPADTFVKLCVECGEWREPGNKHPVEASRGVLRMGKPRPRPKPKLHFVCC